MYIVICYFLQTEVVLTPSQKLQDMITQQGVPHSLRPFIWPRLCGAITKKQNSGQSYPDIVKASSIENLVSSKQIEKVTVYFTSRMNSKVVRIIAISYTCRSKLTVFHCMYMIIYPATFSVIIFIGVIKYRLSCIFIPRLSYTDTVMLKFRMQLLFILQMDSVSRSVFLLSGLVADVT